MITMLKLGGSLITDKTRAHTARTDVLRRLAEEIASVWLKKPFPLIIGHGSGSFGHIPAKKYGTRDGVRTKEDWAGFAEVHAEAVVLNRIVTDCLREAGLPVLSFVPMDSVHACDGKAADWNTANMENCISQGLIPLIFGDTVFDSLRGGTILSTEDLFLYLCERFQDPPDILLAGLEAGVWEDYPKNTKLVRCIQVSETETENYIRGSEFTDVTGGMREKVHLMKDLILRGKAASAMIFSGAQENNVKNALSGIPAGTVIRLQETK